MTRWHWVRHGPTHAKGFVGWTDLPADLSDTAAIARLGAFLPPRALVVSSDLIRAVTTADAIAEGRTRLPHARDLRELHFGDWEGRHWREISESHPELSRAYWDEPGAHRAPGGESWDDTAARVSAFVDRMNAVNPDSDIIAVAHFGVILTQVARAAGISAKGALAHRIDNLSVTELHFDVGSWRACQINHRP